MRGGRQLARSTKKYASEQRGRSWFHLLTTVSLVVGLVTVICAGFPWFVGVLASVILALVLSRLFIIYHDYQHGAVFADSKLLRGFFWLYGVVQLTPPSIWKHTHDTHHRDNGRRFGLDTVGTFPVLTVDEYRRSNRRARFLYRLSRHPLTIAFGYLTVFFFTFCVYPFFSNPKKHLDSGAAVLLHIALIVVLAVVRPDVLILALLVPMFLASALGSYLFYAQHNFPGVQLRAGADWDHVFAALHSSSFLRLGPVMNWFTGNIGYHHIHHLNHKIPFYRLPEAMAGEEQLQSVVSTTLSPVDIFRCLRLQLWEPRSKRLISFADARALTKQAQALPAGTRTELTPDPRVEPGSERGSARTRRPPRANPAGSGNILPVLEN